MAEINLQDNYELLLFLRARKKKTIENIYLINFDEKDITDIMLTAPSDEPNFKYLSRNNSSINLTKLRKVINPPSTNMGSPPPRLALLSQFNQYNVWYKYRNIDTAQEEPLGTRITPKLISPPKAAGQY